MRISGRLTLTMTLICFLSTIACSTKNEIETVKVYVDSLVSSTNPFDESRITFYLFTKKQSAIDQLINYIDTNSFVGPVDLMDRLWSTLPDIQYRTRYAGELALYNIELIVTRDTLFNLNQHPSMPDSINPAFYGLWGYVEVQGTDSIELSDMIEIKKLYIDWWDRVKSLPMREIREDWKENGGPLANTKYKVR